MENKFKRVPAVEKCFRIIEILARNSEPLGITEISKRLKLSKSTVYNIVYTLAELHVLESLPSGGFTLGNFLYTVAQMAGKKSSVIQLVHPYLETVKEKTGLSVFLGVRSGAQAVLIDKAEADFGIKLTSDIGMAMPPLAGAGIKAMLSQLAEEKIVEIVSKVEMKKFTERTIDDKQRFIEEIYKVKREGIAYDFEEYIDGMIGLAVPIDTRSKNVQSAIWVVGLKSQLPPEKIEDATRILLSVKEEINKIGNQKGE